MFRNYPITIQTMCMSENDLFEQILEIKKLKNLGFDSSLFFSVLSNAHNRSTNHQKNSFTIESWISHYGEDSIVVNGEQIQLFLEYLQRFHNSLISEINGKYTLLNSPDKNNFGVELIVLKSVEDL